MEAVMRVPIDISPEQLDIMRHALGYNYEPRHVRNWYAIEPQSKDVPIIQDLVSRGLMASGGRVSFADETCFVVTDAGHELVRQSLPKPKTLTRGQERYQRYRLLSDVIPDLSFIEFCKHENDYRWHERKKGMSLPKNDVEIQRCITDEFRSAMGGPGSLKWPSHQLLPALIRLAALLMRLTLRKVADVAPMLEEGARLVNEEMRQRFQRNEPNPQQLRAVDHPSVERVYGFLLAVSGLPQPYKKPSHLVLGAVCCVCGQLAALRREDIAELLPILERSAAQVPDSAITAFQQAAGNLRN